MPSVSSSVLAGVALAACCVGLQAQWAWRDKDGRRVYSDQPPPLSVPDKDILRQPSVGGRGTSPEPLAAEPAVPTAPPPPRAATPTAADKELERRRKQAEDAEDARKKAAAEQQAKARAENCRQARQARATLDSGMRIARVNAQGEREVLDDEARAAEVRRVQGVINADCGPGSP